jgi:Mor family transcriptional regulator
MNDLLADVLQRVSAITQLPPEQIQAIEAELRADWGGDRAYIARMGECGARLQAQRDIRIRQQHRDGESVRLLSRRWNLSERQVYRIITGSR